ncbi:Coatomer subunit zeta-1 [Trichinella nelsoni]|uniref:Zeta-coat protein n=1 Tax=Trichinella nelsoni TaxID=6336 RepID=A0A0V0SFG1_9BILA|nr:Coatomer subunit zeta-1 [Trichinella nelsoni]
MRRDLSPKCVKGMMILDSDGKRILSKYYDDAFNNTKEQKAFEKKLYTKTHKANAEIVMLDGFVCVYKSSVDLYFAVIGGSNENELILQSVLNCFYESVCQILKKNVDKKNLFSNLDMIMLAMDEICESGIILEVDSNNVMSRIAQRGDDLTFAEQTVAQVGEIIDQSMGRIPSPEHRFVGDTEEALKCSSEFETFRRAVPIFVVGFVFVVLFVVDLAFDSCLIGSFVVKYGAASRLISLVEMTFVVLYCLNCCITAFGYSRLWLRMRQVTMTAEQLKLCGIDEDSFLGSCFSDKYKHRQQSRSSSQLDSSPLGVSTFVGSCGCTSGIVVCDRCSSLVRSKRTSPRRVEASIDTCAPTTTTTAAASSVIWPSKQRQQQPRPRRDNRPTVDQYKQILAEAQNSRSSVMFPFPVDDYQVRYRPSEPDYQLQSNANDKKIGRSAATIGKKGVVVCRGRLPLSVEQRRRSWNDHSAAVWSARTTSPKQDKRLALLGKFGVCVFGPSARKTAADETQRQLQAEADRLVSPIKVFKQPTTTDKNKTNNGGGGGGGVVVPSALERSWDVVGRRLPLERFRFNDDRLLLSAENFKLWMLVTIIRPLVDEIESTNERLASVSPNDVALALGDSPPTVLQTVVASRVGDRFGSLAVLLNYLEATSGKTMANQKYVIVRLKQLAADVAIGEYKWNGGSSFEGKPWDSATLPTDTEILCSLLCTFLDSLMPINPLSLEAKTFTDAHMVRGDRKRARAGTDPLHIHQTHLSPPHYKLVDHGQIYDVGAGKYNFFFTLVLFFQTLKLKRNSLLGPISLGPGGLNLAWTLVDLDSSMDQD